MIKRLIGTLLVFSLTACSSAVTGSQTPFVPTASLTGAMQPSSLTNIASIESMIKRVDAKTDAIKARLSGVANVVTTSGGADLYIRGKLVDSIQMNGDGTGTHTFSNGQQVTERYFSSTRASRRPMILSLCAKMQQLIQTEENQLYWDDVAIVVALGASAAAIVFSGGVLVGLAGGTDAALIAAWVAQKASLDSTESTYIAAGC